MPKRRDENAPYWVQLREAERHIIEFALEHGGSIRGTAAILGISPNYLRERTRELNIDTPEVRPGPKPGTKPPVRVDKPDLRVVAANGTPRPPTLPAGAPLRADADEEDNELEDEHPEDALDEDEDDEEDEDDDEEDDAEDDADAGGEAQSGN
jgi:hypothetical protein